MTIPSLDAVNALNGRHLALLEAHEIEVLRFYATQGRKFDVSVGIDDNAYGASPIEDGLRQPDWVRRRGGVVSITMGAGAQRAWMERAIALAQ